MYLSIIMKKTNDLPCAVIDVGFECQWFNHKRVSEVRWLVQLESHGVVNVLKVHTSSGAFKNVCVVTWWKTVFLAEVTEVAIDTDNRVTSLLSPPFRVNIISMWCALGVCVIQVHCPMSTFFWSYRQSHWPISLLCRFLDISTAHASEVWD